MAKRSFTQLKKSMGDSEFAKFCQKMTEEYARSNQEFARSYFCNTYNISVSCYYKVMEHAIVTNLVDDTVVDKVIAKAMKNQELHKEGAGGRSVVKYHRMYAERCKYIANSFSDEEASEIAKLFADCPELKKEDVASIYFMESTKILDFVLERAILTKLVDDEVFEAIKDRSLSKNSTQSAIRYFESLKQRREMNN